MKSALGNRTVWRVCGGDDRYLGGGADQRAGCGVYILHAIAGGLLGLASFKEGADSAVAGLLLQWAMSIVVRGVYVFAATWMPVLKRLWIAGGLVYGVGIFVVMNYVVKPLSAYHRMAHFSPAKFAENMAAMLLFGLIVAFFARRVQR